MQFSLPKKLPGRPVRPRMRERKNGVKFLLQAINRLTPCGHRGKCVEATYSERPLFRPNALEKQRQCSSSLWRASGTRSASVVRGCVAVSAAAHIGKPISVAMRRMDFGGPSRHEPVASKRPALSRRHCPAGWTCATPHRLNLQKQSYLLVCNLNVPQTRRLGLRPRRMSGANGATTLIRGAQHQKGGARIGTFTSQSDPTVRYIVMRADTLSSSQQLTTPDLRRPTYRLVPSIRSISAQFGVLDP